MGQYVNLSWGRMWGWGLSPPQPSPDKMTKPKKMAIKYAPTQKSFQHDRMTWDILSYIMIYFYMFLNYT